MSDAHIVQLSLDEAKERLKDIESYDRLMKNRDFQHLIKKRFMLEEPVRLVHMLQDPRWATPDKQASLQREMQTIAGFLQWMNTVEQTGDRLRDDVKRYETELELIHQEDKSE